MRKDIIIIVALLIGGVAVFFGVPAGLVRAGERAMAQKEWGKAEDYFSYALTVNPWRKNLYGRMGQAEYWQGNFDEALRLFQKAQQSGLNPRDYYYWVGSVEFLRGNYEKALESFEKVAPPEAMTAEELNSLAAAYLEVKEYRNAKLFAARALGRAIESSNKNVQAKAYNNLGLAFARDGDLDTGERLIKDALKIGIHPMFYDSLGEVYERKGDIAAAIDAYGKYVEIAPRFTAPIVSTYTPQVKQKLTELQAKLPKP